MPRSQPLLVRGRRFGPRHTGPPPVRTAGALDRPEVSQCTPRLLPISMMSAGKVRIHAAPVNQPPVTVSARMSPKNLMTVPRLDRLAREG